MEYTIKFRSADEVNSVLKALGAQPHDAVRPIMDSIVQQAAAIEKQAMAEAKAKPETSEEEKTEEKSTVEEVKEAEKADS